eukprot:6205408-Amphidinium_carterae.1
MPTYGQELPKCLMTGLPSINGDSTHDFLGKFGQCALTHFLLKSMLSEASSWAPFFSSSYV